MPSITPGEQYGNFTAICELIPRNWQCECDCGETSVVQAAYLLKKRKDAEKPAAKPQHCAKCKPRGPHIVVGENASPVDQVSN